MRPLYVALTSVLALMACDGCYHLPLWKGDVKVTPLERKAVAQCGKGGPTEEGGKRLTREPYVMSTTTTSTTVVWGSTDTRGQVVLTEPGGEVVKTVNATYVGDRDSEARRRSRQKTDPKNLPAEDIYVIAAKIDGLEPTHLYCYQVVVDGVALTERAPIGTAAAPGLDEPTRFVAVGDVGTGGPAQEAIARRMTEVPFDFMLLLGDIAYESGTAAQLQGKFFAPYKDVMRYVPIFPSIGNHERRTREGEPYFEAFVLPEPERYYSFDWGDVHFVAIDTTQRDAKQVQWLDDDLRKNKQPWVIVFGHHPMYTNSLRGPQMWIRQAFAKTLTNHKVDMVVTGHEHQYERFKVGGVNYIVSGGGGGRLTRFFGTQRALKQATVHHYLSFEVTKNKLVMKAIDINGKEIETLTLEKKPSGEKKSSDPRQTPVVPEQKIKTDERIHDKPDDDKTKREVEPPITEPTPVPAQTTNATPPKLEPDSSPNTSEPEPKATPATPPKSSKATKKPSPESTEQTTKRTKPAKPAKKTTKQAIKPAPPATTPATSPRGA